MLIMHADDEELARDLVSKTLSAKGYKILSLDSSRTEEMTRRLKDLRAQHGEPDIFILDGHNILRDPGGNPLYDMTPLGFVAWLRQNGLPEQCKFILYSNDDRLVEQARSNRHLHISEAVPKAGSEGGLLALTKAVERVART